MREIVYRPAFLCNINWQPLAGRPAWTRPTRAGGRALRRSSAVSPVQRRGGQRPVAADLAAGQGSSGEALAHGLRGDPQDAGGLGDADQVVPVRRSPQAAVGTISRP